MTSDVEPIDLSNLSKPVLNAAGKYNRELLRHISTNRLEYEYPTEDISPAARERQTFIGLFKTADLIRNIPLKRLLYQHTEEYRLAEKARKNALDAVRDLSLPPEATTRLNNLNKLTESNANIISISSDLPDQILQSGIADNHPELVFELHHIAEKNRDAANTLIEHIITHKGDAGIELIIDAVNRFQTIEESLTEFTTIERKDRPLSSDDSARHELPNNQVTDSIMAINQKMTNKRDQFLILETLSEDIAEEESYMEILANTFKNSESLNKDINPKNQLLAQNIAGDILMVYSKASRMIDTLKQDLKEELETLHDERSAASDRGK